MTPVQLRVARSLLSMKQQDLSEASKVARATINRYESGKTVGDGSVRLMRYALEAAGIVFVRDGAVVDGVPVFDCVGRRPNVASAPRDPGDGTDDA